MTIKQVAMTAEEMRIMRETLNMSQEQFAERLNVHRVTVARWETGLLDIDTRTAFAVKHLMFLEATDVKTQREVEQQIEHEIDQVDEDDK